MKFFITGPQRSGTTFFSNVLSQDLEIPLVDEAEFDAVDYDRFYEAVSRFPSWVCQAPALFHKVFDVYRDFPDVSFIIIRRNVEDILKSQKRIDWKDRQERDNLRISESDPRPIAQIKYELWDSWKKYLPNYQEINYEDLRTHRLWVEPELRKNFHSKQWAL